MVNLNKMGAANSAIIFLTVIVIAGLLAYIFLANPNDPGGVDFGTEVGADWIDGKCQAREGILIGMCCSTWDSAQTKEISVPCEELVEDTNVQAFLTLDGANRLERLTSIAFMVRITNDGNFDTDVQISDVSAVAITDGDAAGEYEIESKMSSILHEWKTAPRGGYADFPMSDNNKISLDIPGHFEMTDGVYEVTITYLAKDEYGKTIPGGSRVISFFVEQEVIRFSIEVTQSG